MCSKKNQPLLLASLLFAVAGNVAAAEFKMLSGVEYSSGKYGAQQSTNIWYYHVTPQYETDNWIFKLTLPYVSIAGPGNVAGAAGNGGQVIARGNNTPTVTSGQGDIVGAVSYNLVRNTEQNLLLDMTSKVKFATANAAQGLGTGKNDYSLQLDLTQQQQEWAFFSSLGYRKMGDTSTVNFKNPWFASLGTGYTLSQDTQLGAAYNTQQAVVLGGAPIKEMMLFWAYTDTNLHNAHALAEHTLQSYVIKGFSDGSPAWGLGLVVQSRF